MAHCIICNKELTKNSILTTCCHSIHLECAYFETTNTCPLDAVLRLKRNNSSAPCNEETKRMKLQPKGFVQNFRLHTQGVPNFLKHIFEKEEQHKKQSTSSECLNKTPCLKLPVFKLDVRIKLIGNGLLIDCLKTNTTGTTIKSKKRQLHLLPPSADLNSITATLSRCGKILTVQVLAL
uniref:RING-type domain-containing protein n=1 Tax=Meloidogyne hapla TaxID=6305 RepID=A0A1I8AZ70_MELHA